MLYFILAAEIAWAFIYLSKKRKEIAWALIKTLSCMLDFDGKSF